MLNHITVMGRLTKDPELRRTGNGNAVASFTLAVDRDFSKEEKKTDFINCVAWRQTGEFVSKYFAKGRMMVASGRLEMREWNDKDGSKRISSEINVDNAYFGDSKKSSEGNSTYTAPNASQGSQNAFADTEALINKYQQQGMQSDFAMLEDTDAQLPF